MKIANPLHSYSRPLQEPINAYENDWKFHVPDLPSTAAIDGAQVYKSISLVSNGKRNLIKLSLQPISWNRAIAKFAPNELASISFADFRLRLPKMGSCNQEDEPATMKQSQEYIVRLLTNGITINGTCYNFFGHSNSQLKSRSCYLVSASKKDIQMKVDGLGEFGNIKSVAKKAKRIGLLFSSAEAALTLEPGRTEDIEDITKGDYIFTDGCGNISETLARQLVKKRSITYRNRQYLPSVFQIRYRGYKGVLALDKRLKGKSLAQFRLSMRKFAGVDDLTMAVVDFSKPYAFGYLNDEVVLLLHSLDISTEVFKAKQVEHLELMAKVLTCDARAAFRFLMSLNESELAERILLEGAEHLQGTLQKLVRQEHNKMLNKKQEQRCRIFITKSRLVFGVCDPLGVLKPGQCMIRITSDEDGQARTLINTEVLVTRNPCLHPGDVQKFYAVESKELSHLVDCIVFPTRGPRPSADLMSGGDLDGDKFFVCWDKDLIPKTMSQAAEYPGVKEKKSAAPITTSDLLEYFARYNSTSLGRVKNLYLEWARRRGPQSAECQQLNRLFSQCVDGNRIRVPSSLELPPEARPDDKPFILDIIHAAAKDYIMRDGMSGKMPEPELISDIDDFLNLEPQGLTLSEFERIQIVARWCQERERPFSDYAHCFDYNSLSQDQKAWVFNMLPVEENMLCNALTQSSLLRCEELVRFGLDDPRLRWKRVFNSQIDRMARFLEIASLSIEAFHRKFIIFRVDQRLSLGLYIPCKASQGEEVIVNDRIRVLAFPHTGYDGSAHRRAVPTKKNYRLYFNDRVFQLYNGVRRDTWVFLARPKSDDKAYRNVESIGDSRRIRQATLDAGINYDFVASVALDKQNSALRKHIGKVKGNGILGAEIYVISNKDLDSLKTLDLWLDYVDTQDVQSLFQEEPQAYRVGTLSGLDYSKLPLFISQVACTEDFSCADSLSKNELDRLCKLMLANNGAARLYKFCEHLLTVSKSTNPAILDLIKVLLKYALQAPWLSPLLYSTDVREIATEDLWEELESCSLAILRSLILRANELKFLVLKPYEAMLSHVKYTNRPQLGELVRLIALAVDDLNLSMDLLLKILEPACSRILVGRPAVNARFVQSLIGIALDHIEEMGQALVRETPLLQLKLLSKSSEGTKCELGIRIDYPIQAIPKNGDHLRLIPASDPDNWQNLQRVYVDSIVVGVQQGSVTIECIQALPSFAEQCSWKIVACTSFVTSRVAFDATISLFSNAEACEIADIIDGRESVLPDGESRSDDTISSAPLQSLDEYDLNDCQLRAVQAAMTSRVLCLWGPPGTGKTHTILAILKQLISESPEESRFLVTAPTNNAVDNILLRFNASFPEIVKSCKAVRVATDSRRVSVGLSSFICNAFDQDRDAYSQNFKARREAEKRVKESRLVFTTCIGSALGLLKDKVFETVIIDEASQATETASYAPLTKGCKKAILVGDHVQLRPTVGQNAVTVDFDQSLFERLYTQKHEPDGFKKIMLDVQYRMHDSICNFPSHAFYEGRLKTGVSRDSRQMQMSEFPWPGEQRCVFIQCDAVEDLGQKSKCNRGQSELCTRVFDKLTKQVGVNEGRANGITILTPYTSQRSDLQARIPAAEVASIDGFQGREADIIIFVTSRCNVKCEIGFLKDMRRLNVVLTRARLGLIIIGDEATLTQSSEGDEEETKTIWKRLIQESAKVTIEEA